MIFTLVFLLSSLFVVAILHTYLNLSGLKIDVLSSKNIFVGDHAEIKLKFSTQQKQGHVSVLCGWGDEAAVELTIAANSEQLGALYLLAERRGKLVTPRLSIKTYYPLGLLRAWSRLALETQVYVYPKPIKQDLRLTTVDSDEGEAESFHQVGGEEFFGFKAYQQGDSLKHIHWQSFAKGQALLTKEFSQLSGESQHLDWSMFEGGVEQRLSALCYWVLQFTQEQRVFSLGIDGQLYGPSSGESFQNQLLLVLALSHPYVEGVKHAS